MLDHRLLVAALAAAAVVPSAASAGWSHPRRLPAGRGFPCVAVAANGTAAVAYPARRGRKGTVVRLRPGHRPRHRALPLAPADSFLQPLGVSAAGRILAAA